MSEFPVTSIDLIPVPVVLIPLHTPLYLARNPRFFHDLLSSFCTCLFSSSSHAHSLQARSDWERISTSHLRCSPNTLECRVHSPANREADAAMSINPQLLVANAADNASESDAADDQELGEREFFVGTWLARPAVSSSPHRPEPRTSAR